MLNSHQLLSLLLKLAKNKDYITLVKTLNDYPDYKRIGIGNLIFRISSDIVKIKMFRKIPKVTLKRTDATRKAIYGCNYELALKLHNKTSDSNYPKEKEILSILLADINNIIKETIIKQYVIMNKEKNLREIKINEIINMLESNQIEKAKELLELYLTSINFKEYIFLINKLIDISVISKDDNFDTIIRLLNDISFSVTFINFQIIIIDFKNSISRGNLEESKLYLDILTKYQPLFKDKINKDELSQYKNLLTSYQAEEAFLTNIINELNKRAINSTLIRDISSKRKEIILKLLRSIPNIVVKELDNNEILLIKDNKITYVKKLLNILIKLYSSNDIQSIINSVNKILISENKDKLKEIAYYIKNNNIPLKLIKIMFNLSDEVVQIVKLLIVELYYIDEEYYKGDILLNEIYDEPRISPTIYNLLIQVQGNRDNYKNTRNFNKRLIKQTKSNNS